MLRKIITVTFILLTSACQVSTPLPPTSPAPRLSTPTLQTAIPLSPEPTVTVSPLSPILNTPQALQGVKVSFWHPLTGDGEKIIQKLVADFNQANIWGIEVDTNSTGGTGALYDSVDQALKNGNPPNVVMASPDQILSWKTSTNAPIDLSPYFLDPNWGLSPADQDDYRPNILKYSSTGTGRFWLPALVDLNVLFYNQSWARDLGISQIPTSLDMLKEQSCLAQAATNKDSSLENNGVGGWILDTRPNTLASWLMAFQSNPFPSSDPAAYEFNTDATTSAFRYLRGLLDGHCAWTPSSQNYFNYFSGRKTIFYSATLQDIPLQEKAFTHDKSSDEWTIIPYANTSAKPNIVGEIMGYSILQGRQEEMLAGWLFARWMNLPENQASLSRGTFYLPVSLGAADRLADFRSQQPQWNLAFQWIDTAMFTPPLGSWRSVRLAVEDAAWQILQPYTAVEKIPSILAQLDQMAAELQQQRP